MTGLRCLGLAVVASLLISRVHDLSSIDSVFFSSNLLPFGSAVADSDAITSADERVGDTTDASSIFRTRSVQVPATKSGLKPIPDRAKATGENANEKKAARASSSAKVQRKSASDANEQTDRDTGNSSRESSASEPAASEPAASEPAASEPAASEPLASEPAERHEAGYRGTSPRADREGTTRLAKLLRGSSPANKEELKTLQSRIRELTPKIIPVTVAIQVGRANGSGVIVDASGHVLTAAHVAGEPGRDAIVFLSDGRVAHGITLGMNQRLDAGLIKITEPGQWPHAPLGHSADLTEGQWCLATGHPGGYNPDRPRPPVLRWGRVLKVDESAILTDCTLVGGDSGGPLFDLQGNVIGIHSRIGKNLTINVHVPIDPYRDSWERLVSGEAWNLMESETAMPWMGVLKNPDSDDATIHQVTPGSPAFQAGLVAGDRIVRVNDVPIATFAELKNEISQLAIGESIEVEIQRGDELHVFKVTIAAHPGTAP